MLSGIHRITSNYTYVPVLTELDGLNTITMGLFCLGISGLAKANECFTGKKCEVSFITNDAALFYEDIAIGALKHGFKKIAPTAGVVLGIYLLTAKIFR